MVCLTRNNLINPMINIIGDINNRTIPKVFNSEKNSIFNTVNPVPKKTIKVLKYAKNVRSLANLVRSIASQSLVISVC